MATKGHVNVGTIGHIDHGTQGDRFAVREAGKTVGSGVVTNVSG